MDSNNICIGCNRTLEEIKTWRVMKETERMSILKKLDTRSKCPECKSWNNCSIENNKSASACWCMSVQAKENIEENKSCLCRQCLKG